jgi:hypothetical protein
MLSIHPGRKIKSLLAAVLCVSFYVGAGNALPVAVSDHITVKEDHQHNFNPAANDTDADGDKLKLLGIHTKPTHGTAYRQGANTKYVPHSNYCGTDSFTYYVGDDKGNKSIGKVNVTVDCVNDAPTANADVMSLKKNNRALLNPLTNDRDSEGDRLQLHSIKSHPENGTVDIISSYVEYTPNQGFCGTDNFSYNVVDSNANKSSALVSITVQCLDEGS